MHLSIRNITFAYSHSPKTGFCATHMETIYDFPESTQDLSDDTFQDPTSDSVILLIDFQERMFDLMPLSDKKLSYIQSTISLAVELYRAKIISSPNDQMGIVLYGTKSSSNPNSFDHIHVLHNLQQPNPETINQLKQLIDPDPEVNSFLDIVEELGYVSDPQQVKFNECLWTCSSMFGKCTKKNSHKRIFLFTCDDNPNRSDSSLQQQSILKMKDLEEMGIETHIFALSPVFRPELFYERLLSVSPSSELISGPDSLESFRSLKERVYVRFHRKRTLTSIKSYLGENTFAFKVYCLIHPNTISGHTLIDAKTNGKVSVSSNYLCERTGRFLESSEIQKNVKFGKESVPLSENDLKLIRNISDFKPGLTFLGFKNISGLKQWYNVKPSYFMYPDDEQVVGSCVLTKTLIEELAFQNKYALGWFSSRPNTMPTIFAMLPQLEELDNDGFITQPYGFNCIAMPYAEDIRKISLPLSYRPDFELIRKTKAMIDSLSLKEYSHEFFENPTLQRHFAALQAMALNEDFPEVVDYTLPNEEQLSKYHDILQEIQHELSPNCISQDEEQSAPKKRKTLDMKH